MSMYCTAEGNRILKYLFYFPGTKSPSLCYLSPFFAINSSRHEIACQLFVTQKLMNGYLFIAGNSIAAKCDAHVSKLIV